MPRPLVDPKTREHQLDVSEHHVVKQEHWTFLTAAKRLVFPCPGCGKTCGLNPYVFGVDPDTGEITPSILCGHDGCEFAGVVKLQGWMGLK